MARALVEMTRKDLEERYNISQHTLHAWEKGTNCITDKNAARLVDIFSKEGLAINTDWLLHGTDLQFSKHHILEEEKIKIYEMHLTSVAILKY